LLSTSPYERSEYGSSAQKNAKVFLRADESTLIIIYVHQFH
jgi:hypothetical protein